MAIKTRKNSVKYKKKGKEIISIEDTCVLCGKVSDDSYLGKLLTTSTMLAHENCLLFSPILKQVYDPDVEQNGVIMGFKITDVEREVKRISRLRCSVCKVVRAGIGCCNVSCRKSFHLSCGLNSNAIGIFKDCFQFYCTDHASSQNLKKHLSACDKTVPECTICLESLIEEEHTDKSIEIQWAQFLVNVNKRIVIHGECCSRCWMHRTCMRQYGLSAGLHHTKCPHCGDKTKFIEAVQQCGIWLPDRDASWELEPGAFQELYDEAEENVTNEMETCMGHELSRSEQQSQETSIDNIENRCLNQMEVLCEDLPRDINETTVVSHSSNSQHRVIAEIMNPTENVKFSPPCLRKRIRPSDWCTKSASPKNPKRRRVSKNNTKQGFLVQQMCVKCTKTIVSLNCKSPSILNDNNQKQQVTDESATVSSANTSQIDYVCVACHK